MSDLNHKVEMIRSSIGSKTPNEWERKGKRYSAPKPENDYNLTRISGDWCPNSFGLFINS